MGFGPTCWHRLSIVAGPTRPLTIAAPRGQASGPDASADGVPRQAAPVSLRADAPGTGLTVRPARARFDAQPVAVAIGWLVIVAALLALVEYWRWVVIGGAVLAGVAALGVLLEWLQARRHEATTVSSKARPPRP